MDKITKIYIGANNETGQVEIEKIKQVLGVYFTGYTITKATGVWRGTEEESIVVEIVGNDKADDTIARMVRRLKEVTEQMEILVTHHFAIVEKY